MRLTKLKLAGFKSFVDPTTLIVPGNLVGVVGPNGCGKSNIIDAVTWVMGESSAKHLRGDALTDVIFNGSSTRQPVGQASVELIFDNSEGKLGGQYASYSEISVKRQINREAISTYTLNGTRCRRKDIQALFLGTGLGPRGYGIIEQGMISRLIEAKPADLRVFIEEAAGISKFRERRRETETRIRHSHENINRLNDIRDELEKQLNHLQRQAKAAERYQLLKEEERKLKAELISLNWRALKEQSSERAEDVRQQENRLEEAVAKLRHVESEIEKQRDIQTAANESFNQAQSVFYQIGGEISQLEQKIQHTQERAQSLQTDIEGLHESLASVKTQQEHDQDKLKALATQLTELEPELQGSRGESDKAYNTLSEAEQAVQGWQAEWDAFNEASNDFTRQIEVDAARLEHLQSGIEEILERQRILKEQLENTSIDELRAQEEKLYAELQACNESVEEQRVKEQSTQQEISKYRDNLHELNEKLAIKRAEQHKIEGKIASLEALQEDESGGEQEVLARWLDASALREASRLAQKLDVQPEWMLALETVLGGHLHDICLENISLSSLNLQELTSGKVGFLAEDTSVSERSCAHYPCLADKLSSSFQVNRLLHGIYVAENIEEARRMLNDISETESVITKDGIWLSRLWLKVNKQQGESSGVLSREHQIAKLKKQHDLLQNDIQSIEQELDNSRKLIEEIEQSSRSKQDELNSQQETSKHLHAQYAEAKTRSEQTQERMEQIQQELEELETQELSDKQESQSLRARLERTEVDRTKLDEQREQLNNSRERYRLALENARTQWQSTHEQSHEIALQLESLSSQRASLEQAIKRSDIQAGNYLSRIDELENNLNATKEPITGLQKELEAKLEQRVESERNLSEARDKLQSGDKVLRDKELERTAVEQSSQKVRGDLESVRMAAQEINVRLQTVVEQLQEIGAKAEDILSELDDDATLDSWQERLESVERKIHRLGPINLAAIEEFNQLTERKTYLDSQHKDLSDALQILENAIHKIDKETRTRFKETFDNLNHNLKETFPILFGGGHAYMEMTGDDLLETGVTIMARPPGKRNSTIHLLSGGEKALTAVALVFSIFKLNPAPFCILDEVDAPLDDTNVGRFSQMVKEMSADVQFLFITHNKITMEIAHQLLGVTMHEAGVSRIVSVDMDEAVILAESA